MAPTRVNAVIRLTHDVPNLWLSRGDVGVVQSVWPAPPARYEVEFARPGQPCVRVLLDGETIEVIEPPAADAAGGTK